MSTIVATADNARSLVRLDLDFSDIDAPYAYVVRVDPTTGATTAVRGHGSTTTIGGLAYTPMQAGFRAVLYDTELPLNSSFYYTATAPAVTLNATSQFSGGYIDPWFPSDPTIVLAARSTLNGTPYLQFNSPGALATPQARAEDVPATPGATLTFTAVMSANVSQSVSAGITFRDATGAVLSAPVTTVSAQASTSVVVSAAAPAGTVSAQPFIQMNSTPAATTFVSITSAAMTNAAGSAASSGVSVPSLGSCQLKDPLRPALNVRIDFIFDPNPLCIPTEGIFWQSLDSESQAPNAATFNVNNQANPVVVSKIRSSITSTLTLVSRTFADRDRLNALMLAGSPLLFQVPPEYAQPDRFLSIGTTQVSRVLPDHRFPIRVFSLPHVVTSGPGGLMQGVLGTRWTDTCNRYASWAAVKTAGLTWVQVLDGAAG